jgi:AcrR family transcriptional regulator
MVRTWSDDDPKAALMARKRAALVEAALRAFLERGYAESSVNRIAEAAGVSIKTLYRHFSTKDELFSAVMDAACFTSNSGGQIEGSEPAWYAEPPHIGLALAGETYLRHALSEDQLALYRVVTRDAHRFPELGRRYLEEVVGRRDAIFTAYLDRWLPSMGWRVADKRRAAEFFAGLLKGGLFEEALQGGRKPDEEQLTRRARDAAACMLALLEAGSL